MTPSNNKSTNINPILIQEKFKYIFDDSTGILYKYYYGKITLEEIYSSWDFAIDNRIIPKDTKGYILDYRQATFDFDIREYVKISDYYKSRLAIFQGLKIGIISELPRDVAILMLFKSKDNGYSTKPFNTVEAAIEWVLSSI